ncbi:MAG: cupin domain-containing protein [Elusimicrobia bacterium]|nr:cupin domain-containing protein [Elusimicrobiota bacterium]
MGKIKVKRPSKEELKKLNVKAWGSWGCEVSSFDWEYSDDETCYILEGKVNVETPDGTVEINKGDLVTFPKGLKCKWNVLEKINKVYKFGGHE